MPAMVTHYMFGESLLPDFPGIGAGTEEARAFLLGNQGPDTLFYAFLNPLTAGHSRLGNLIHDLDPARLMVEWNRAVWELSGSEKRLVAAYAAGFACHYLLDANVHPMVEFYQAKVCADGDCGLGPGEESTAHAAIEREIDEMMLYRATGRTIADSNPTVAMLALGDSGLSAVGRSMASVAGNALGVDLPPSFFPRAAKSFRRAWGILGRPQGVPCRLLRAAAPRSFVFSMVLRPMASGSTRFANLDRAAWVDSVTGETRSESLFDLMEAARAEAREWVPRILSHPGVSLEEAQIMTRGRNFSGHPSPQVPGGAL